MGELPFGLTQDDIDRAARKLADLGWDRDIRPPVEGVGVSPGLRMATYLALKAAADGVEMDALNRRGQHDSEETHG